MTNANRFTASGNYDTDEEPREDGRSRRRKSKERAEFISRMEVGDESEWEQFEDQADGQIGWENYEAWLGKRGWQFAEKFNYVSPRQDLLYEAHRYNFRLMPSKKIFILRHKEGDKWVRGAGPVRVPYNLAAMLANPNDEIAFQEGEKGVEAAKRVGLLSACVQGQNWTDDVAQFYANRIVNITMDNDDAGRANTLRALEWLHKVGATVRIIQLPNLAPRAGLDDWLAEHSVEEFRALVSNTKPMPSVANLKAVNPADWQGKPVPKRVFVVDPLIPDVNVALLYGDGGLGKSLLALQLAVARAIEQSFLGLPTKPGRTLVFSAEDDLNELHRRLSAICVHYGVQIGQLGEMRLIDLVGRDAVIGELARSGRIVATELYQYMIGEMAQFNPGLVIIDALADSYAGDENNRTQARQFISMLRQPAMAYDCAFLAVAHPSLSGITTGRGTSGTTGWNNSVRSRMYFETITTESGSEPDPNLKMLRQPKGNYSAPGFELPVRYENGVYVPVVTDSSGRPIDRGARQVEHEQIFLCILRRLFEQRRYVTNTKGVNFAPAVFVNETEARERMVTKSQLQEAMLRLFHQNRIKLETYGPPSKLRNRIEEASF
jgi:RecA-family ATPase